MLQFEIVVNTLKVSDGSNTIFSISKKDVYYIQTSLNEAIPKITLYNVNVGIFSVVFNALLSECSDPNGDPFTVNTFTAFAEDNLGFNSGGASPQITVTDSYATLPDPTTVSGEFYWCENADGTFPVGLYYSDGITWQFQVADDITVVANYSALPNPTTVNGQFFWAEASQGTAWLPANVGGTYYSAGMYYSNGVSWSFLDVPYQATQVEVDAGTNTNKFVTPKTFTDASKWSTKQNVLSYTPYKFLDATQVLYAGSTLGIAIVIGLTETIVSQTTILGGTFNVVDLMKIFYKFSKPVGVSTVTMRIRINTTNTLVGATQISILGLLSNNTYGLENRNINLYSGLGFSYNVASSVAGDINNTNTTGTSFNLDTTNDLYVFFTIQFANLSDSATFQLANITN
jgi:hypothetical protein